MTTCDTHDGRPFTHTATLILEVWGQTEDCRPTSMNLSGRIKIETVGEPLPGVKVRIDADGEAGGWCKALAGLSPQRSGRPCPAGRDQRRRVCLTLSRVPATVRVTIGPCPGWRQWDSTAASSTS